MRKFVTNKRFLITATSAVLVFVIAESFTASRIAQAQSTFAPFTIRQENRQFDATHDAELIDVRTAARRSDGAYTEMGHIFGKQGLLAGEHARKVTMPDGSYFTVYDQLRGVTTYSAPESRKKLAATLRNSDNCVHQNEQSVGKETIMGQDTVAVRWPGFPTVRVTQWRALSLNCEALKAIIEEKQPDGTYKMHNQISTVSLVLGEPDPSLFAVPKDYTEMKPSEFMHKEAAKLGAPVTADMEKTAEKHDEQYSKYH